MTVPELPLFASLRDAYDASRRVRSAADLTAVLERVAELVQATLGWRSVAVHVHRRAWDDFETAVVLGADHDEAVTVGATCDWAEWSPMFHDRLERRGAYLAPDRWLVLMRGDDGDVTGILSVTHPVSGGPPADAELDALVAVADAAGAALQQAREAAAKSEHQAALEHLLGVSTRITDARSRTAVLNAVCSGIGEALGFERVAIELADADGALTCAAHAGWDDIPDIPISIDHFARILLPEFEQSGCYLVDHSEALRILGLPDSPYESQRNGRGPWAWSRHWLCVPLRDPDGATTGMIVADEPRDRLLPDRHRLQALRLFADQAQAALEAARQYERTLHMAEHDLLTGLPNRALLLDRIQHAIQRSRRLETTIALLFVDLDRFKAVNDTHGHDVGDEVLRVLSARIDEALRPGDTVARIGGDEFVVLCEAIRDPAHALEISRRLRAHLARPVRCGAVTVTLTASVGVSLPVTGDENGQALLRFADVAMYRAKEIGRDAEELASDAIRAGASAKARLERALGGAQDRGEMRMVYQPIVDVESGRILRAEALMRWEHPGLGHVSPLEFIPLAEENGSIAVLGRWALEEACREWSRWREECGEAGPAVAVNVSPRQLRDPHLRAIIARLLVRHDMPRGALTVEVTEGALLDASAATMRTLDGLRDLGCRIELDDFGTGYSSLSSLAEFSVDGLKIDRRFVSGRERGPRADAIAQAVLAMADALELRATAEGVETAEQLEWLRSRGCREAQGYLFSRPVSGDEFLALLATPATLAPAAASAP